MVLGSFTIIWGHIRVLVKSGHLAQRPSCVSAHTSGCVVANSPTEMTLIPGAMTSRPLPWWRNHSVGQAPVTHPRSSLAQATMTSLVPFAKDIFSRTRQNYYVVRLFPKFLLMNWKKMCIGSWGICRRFFNCTGFCSIFSYARAILCPCGTYTVDAALSNRITPSDESDVEGSCGFMHGCNNEVSCGLIWHWTHTSAVRSLTMTRKVIAHVCSMVCISRNRKPVPCAVRFT